MMLEINEYDARALVELARMKARRCAINGDKPYWLKLADKLAKQLEGLHER